MPLGFVSTMARSFCQFARLLCCAASKSGLLMAMYGNEGDFGANNYNGEEDMYSFVDYPPPPPDMFVRGGRRGACVYVPAIVTSVRMYVHVWHCNTLSFLEYVFDLLFCDVCINGIQSPPAGYGEDYYEVYQKPSARVTPTGYAVTHKNTLRQAVINLYVSGARKGTARVPSRAGGRQGSGDELVRPMTSVSGAGYKSGGRGRPTADTAGRA